MNLSFQIYLFWKRWQQFCLMIAPKVHMKCNFLNWSAVLLKLIQLQCLHLQNRNIIFSKKNCKIISICIYEAEQGDSIEMVQYCSLTEFIIVIEITLLYKRAAWDLQSQCKTRSRPLHKPEREHFANNSTDFNDEQVCLTLEWSSAVFALCFLTSPGQHQAIRQVY